MSSKRSPSFFLLHSIGMVVSFVLLNFFCLLGLYGIPLHTTMLCRGQKLLHSIILLCSTLCVFQKKTSWICALCRCPAVLLKYYYIAYYCYYYYYYYYYGQYVPLLPLPLYYYHYCGHKYVLLLHSDVTIC